MTLQEPPICATLVLVVLEILMKTLSIAEGESLLGEHLNLNPGESLVITAHGIPTLRVFTEKTGRRLVLAGFSAGVLSAGEAMDLLGIDWRGDLLDALAEERIERPDARMTDKERDDLERALPLLREILENQTKN